DQDGLTGLLGRAGFLRAAQAVHEAQQHQWVREQARMALGPDEGELSVQAGSSQALTPPSQGPAVLMLIDLDRFQRINASFGPHAGDEALREVASRLQQAFRNLPQVIFGRLGGDEFGVLFPELPSEQAARQAAQIVLARLRAPMVCAGREFVLGASIGIATHRPALDLAGLPIDLMLTQAAQALRSARSAGGNAAHGPEAAAVPSVRVRDDLETHLHLALQRDELRLHYQPIVDPASGRVTGFEALMRWQREDRLMMPGEFIPLAEQTGAIVPMGEWAVREALRQLRVWRSAGLSVPGVAVNIHPQQLRLDEFAQTVGRELEVNGLEGEDLEIELTETGLIQDIDRAIESLRGLKRLGVSVALDDFGTGYSSLSYLSRLPIDTLKIDRSFVDTLGAQPQSDAVVRSITALAQALGLSTVAEGVETRQQLLCLQQFGCDDVQGYLVSRPIPADQVAQWWRLRQQAPFGLAEARSL
ncbi:MAG: putative bifunctional diguanylate cyclase/phosphodiesterase, partial [Burkholderiales bacterium]